MCGDPYTQAQWIAKTNREDPDYTLVGTYTKGEGKRQQTAITVREIDEPMFGPWVYNVYSADGRDYTFYRMGDDGLNKAAKSMKAHGFTLVEPVQPAPVVAKNDLLEANADVLVQLSSWEHEGGRVSQTIVADPTSVVESVRQTVLAR